MTGLEAAEALRKERHFLMNIVSGFAPEHGEFRPAEGMMTVAQQINHVAMTLYWFHEGGFGEGFETDFAKLEEENRREISFEDAVEKLQQHYEGFIQTLEDTSAEEMASPMPPNPFFGDSPKEVIISANMDHTAHHRGALAVYQRLLGITPKMVYTD